MGCPFGRFDVVFLVRAVPEFGGDVNKKQKGGDEPKREA
jgi:hypothetical protein